MPRTPEPWDYLIVTAANRFQAAAYDAQIELRRRVGQLALVRHVLVVPDIDGKRIGSGGSTVECLRRVVEWERKSSASRSASVESMLSQRRILIIHAGGDSRRLPAYSACGKIFVPLPVKNYSALGTTLFDRLAQSFLEFSHGPRGAGQVVVASGDALITFDAALDLTRPGMTVLGTCTTPEEAARHGVFCPDSKGAVRLVLQKPSLAEQATHGAIDSQGRTVLDIGVMSFDASVAAQLLNAFCVVDGKAASIPWRADREQSVLENGIDLYREICCTLGTESSLEHYKKTVRSSGSKVDDALLTALYASLRSIPVHLQVLDHCSFLHFGSTRQLITSGIALMAEAPDQSAAPGSTVLIMNTEIAATGSIVGTDAWVEGSRVRNRLILDGSNVLVGVDVTTALDLPYGACLDLSEGLDRMGKAVWFVRCYGINDTFKHGIADGATFCGKPLAEWLDAVGAVPADFWPLGTEERTLWNASVSPAETDKEGYRNWVWMFDVDRASVDQKLAFLSADRYSSAEVATLVDQKSFHVRRAANRAAEIQQSVEEVFSTRSNFSSRDLAFALEHSEQPEQLVASLLTLAHERLGVGGTTTLDCFHFCRITHCLSSAIDDLAADKATELETLVPGLTAALPDPVRLWADASHLSMAKGTTARKWSTRLRELAFQQVNDSIVSSSLGSGSRPHNALRPGETVWGRCPARIELGGGWSDTPPYTLERGGDVANTAINLNGQPPIHCYCRILEEPAIYLNSIDGGQRLRIDSLAELLDYRRPGDPFALTKGALAISGFAPEMADWPKNITLPEMLKEFGGGIEINTLVGIPQGSGLGTSSILGAVILGVINRMTGHPVCQQELFHNVLRLEQALTTGGGWQDQVGGCAGGSKLTTTGPGVFPDANIQPLPSDVLEPKLNGGCTLLYYTGLTRIAKNILQQIVGGYLDRDPAILSALAEEHVVARNIADAMARKDIAAFGACVDAAWELQKRLCKTVTNPAIESLLLRVRPFVHGMRISGAGSGGFLLIVAKSPEDAAHVRQMLESEPLNERSRFFDFEVNNTGLEVTTC